MSDNVPMEVCQQKMNASLRMPATEVWVETLSFLPRRILVKRIQPVCKFLKNVCNKHVKTVHVITNANAFLARLNEDYPSEAVRKQVEALTANSCQLASQFRMAEFGFDIKIGGNEAIQAIFRHCMDLFLGCQIYLHFKCLQEKETDEQFAWMTLFGTASPVHVKLVNVEKSGVEILEIFLRHPTVLECHRLTVTGSFWTMAVYQWLHYKPMDSCNDEEQPELRCLTFPNNDEYQAVVMLLDCAVCHFRQSRAPSFRRHFLLTFNYNRPYPNFDNFGRLENPATGEVLSLGRVQGEDDQETRSYRLLRCMASQVANGMEEFYGKLFKPDGEFNVEDREGNEPAKVQIL